MTERLNPHVGSGNNSHTAGIDHGVRPREVIHQNIAGRTTNGAAGLAGRDTTRVAWIVSEG
jgi:hypothetical protein